MANMLLGYSDWGDEATVDEVSHETSGFEGTQVQTTQPSDYWEAASGSPYIVFDRGSAQRWTVVAALFTNMADGDTWRIRAADTKANLTTTPDFDTGNVAFRVAGDDDTWPRHHGLRYEADGQTRRWLRIDFSVAGGTLECGRIVVGDFFQPAVNDSFGRSIGVSDPSSVARSDGGALFADAREPFLVATIALQFLTEAEAFGTIMELQRLRGRRSDLTFIGDPEETTYLRQQLLYGRLSRVRPITLPSFERYEVRMNFEEAL